MPVLCRHKSQRAFSMARKESVQDGSISRREFLFLFLCYFICNILLLIILNNCNARCPHRTNF